MPTFRFVFVILLVVAGFLSSHAREPRFRTAYRASIQAMAELKLDSINQCTDSLAVRLMTIDSVAGRIIIYDLRNTPDKTISLIYWAESKEYSRQRLFGLISAKVWYLPVYQVGMLYPYQKVSDVISEIPHCSSTGSAAINRICSSVQNKFGTDYSQSHCCTDDCQCVDDLQAFFDKYFYYQKN